MSQDVSFRRKVIYIAAIALLLFPLYRLGQPATRDSAGGKLAQLRSQHDLSQAELGEIDPASESMRLATLGMRGIAANLLWSKSLEYKKKEDWDKLRVTLNQITKLQPNFIKIWEFQAHNLSYNISVEFDDYRHRYHWVKKGISFLTEGTRYNRDNPRLLHFTGWMLGQKIGRADEHTQFRELFREDEDFHDELNRFVVVEEAAGYDRRPDNWLVGRLWYLRAQRAVDIRGVPLRSKSPLVFHADPAMSYINYSWMIEEEGVLGEIAQRAWRRAGDAWENYGKRSIPTTWGHNLRLGELQATHEELARMRERLDELAPGVREEIYAEKVAQLSPKETAALNLRREEITEEAEYQLFMEVQRKVTVTNDEVAQRAPAENRERAERLARRIDDFETLAGRISRYRNVVNYDYWESRCEMEQTKTAVDARENLYKAKEAHRSARLEEARKLYESAWDLWREIYKDYPSMKDDITADELVNSVKGYRRLLDQLDEPFPEDFVLRDFLAKRPEGLEPFYGKPTAAPKSTGTPASKAGISTIKEPAETSKEGTKPETEPSADAKPEPAKPVEKPADAPAKKDDPAAAKADGEPAAKTAEEKPAEPQEKPAPKADAKDPPSEPEPTPPAESKEVEGGLKSTPFGAEPGGD